MRLYSFCLAVETVRIRKDRPALDAAGLEQCETTRDGR
jgi:hypothetical protein